MDETKKRETIAALFNVYRSGRITSGSRRRGGAASS